MALMPRLNRRLRELLKQTFVWMVVTMVVSFGLSYMVYTFERYNDVGLSNFNDLWWWWVLHITSLGAANESPATVGGRIFATLVIFSGMVLFAIVISQVTTIIKLTYERKDKGIIRIGYSDHIVIFGYTSLTAGVVKLLRYHFGKSLRIVLISNDTNFNPFPKEVDFIYANPIDRDTFIEANAHRAMATIILANDRFSDPDAYSLVISTGVESHNPRAITIVEIMNESYKELYKQGKIEAFIDRRELLKDLLEKNEDPKLIRILEKETTLESVDEKIIRRDNGLI